MSKRLNYFAPCGQYLIFDDGRVYSLITDKFIKHDISKKGYHQVTLSGIGRKKVHRLVAMLFIPNPDNLPQVNHKDGNKSNNRVENLEWCDQDYNNKHARGTGLNNIAKSNHDRWLDEEFSKRAKKKMSDAKKGMYDGERNPRFKYLIYKDGERIDKSDLRDILEIAESTLNIQIAKAAAGKKVKKFIKHGITVKVKQKG